MDWRKMSSENDENWSVRRIVSSFNSQDEPIQMPSEAAVQDGLKYITAFLDQIKGQPPAAQIGTGAICGFINGYMVKKLAKMALIGIGGSLLVLTVAHSQGYLSVNRSNLKSDISSWMNK